jgi:SAM-dependent methyltransferase
VLDLAAGTGKFTELLAAREEKFKLVAVEPHDDMRATLAGKKLPGVEVVKGYGSSIPLEDGSVDGVVVAQAFHWFSNRASLVEIARVLKSRGRVGLVWNIEDYNNTLEHESPHPWTKKIRQYLFDLDHLAPEDNVRFRNGVWKKVFEEKDLPFGKLEGDSVEWSVHLGREDLWKRWRTLSQISAMEEGSQQLKDTRKYFDEALDGEGTETDADGKIIVRGETVLFWAEKKE